jgi:hypothetical protein
MRSVWSIVIDALERPEHRDACINISGP